jgi:hypothetical protein
MTKLFTLKALLLVLLSATASVGIKAQSLTEDFSYTAGTLLTANGWLAHSGAGTNAITVTSPGLTYAGHPGSGVGNAISMTTSGEDDNKLLSAPITSGSAYASFLVNVSAATATGDYFIGLLQNASAFPVRVYVKASGAGFVFGIGKQAGTATYEATVRTFGTTYFIATNYIYNAAAQDDAVNLWVNPALGGAEPAATIPNVTFANADATTITAFYVRQGTAASASTQRVDAILAGTTWASVTPSTVVTPTISVAAGLNAGEPATSGTFTISFSTPTTAATTVNYAYTGSAIFGTDYNATYSPGVPNNATSTGFLTVSAGVSSVTVTITPSDDLFVEGTEGVTLTLSAPSGGYTIGTAAASIDLLDNDVPTVAVTAGNNGAEPATNGTFDISLSNPAPAGGVTITYTLSGSALLNTDYTDPQSGSITITQGNSSAVITLNVTDDPNYEGTETIGILLNTASNGYSITGSTASINLADNDPVPPVVINEVYGGGGNSGATYKNDFIELYNPTNAAVNVTGWSVQYASATGTGSWTVTSLTGSIPAHGYYLVQEAAGAGGTTSVPTPDATGSIAMSATAGKVALVSNITPLSGACPSAGVIDEVGYGPTANCFEGAGPAPVLTNTTSAQRDPKGFDTQNNNTDFIVLALPTPKNSVVDILPPVIVSLSPADNATGVMTSFIATVTFNENVVKGTGSITVSKLSDGSVVKVIDVSSADVTTSGTTASFGINSLAFNTAYYIEITGGSFKDGDDNEFTGISGATAWNFTTAATPPAGTLGSTYDFNTCSGNLPGGFTQFSILGPQIWGCTAFGRDAANLPTGSAPNGLQINGFSGVNIPNEDWLISPSFDLGATTFPLLSFWSRTAFTGATLELKVSTDYTGTGDPNLATWTDLNGKFPAQVSDIWKLSENINLSGYKSPHTYFAFVYHSTTEDGARWTLDDITVDNSLTPPPPSLSTSATDIEYTYVANGSSANKTFTFIGNDLTGDVTLNATGAFSLSKDGITFTPGITYTQAEANNVTQTVYVQFAPTAPNQNFAGLVSVSTTGVTTSTINLKGTSIDPATTLEVVNWNMEWFGSTTLGPTNDDLQEQNAATVLRTIGADIYAVVEVVSETRLQHVVANLNATYGAGTYNYIICNYGSHVNPPEPGGQPLSEVQKEAFIYKTSLFSNITTRPMINLGTATPSYNNWSGGRYPFLMTADVTLNCVTKKINFILIHAKANTAPVLTAYDRREAAAKELHDTLTAFFADENIIILGDFNDDLDQSITTGKTITSYHDFTDDGANFFSPTLALSLAGKKSTVSYNDVIDHVMLSNDLQPYYLPESATILTDVASLIPRYGTTTTDHYPVFTRYIFPNSTAPEVSVCTAEVTRCSNAGGSYTIPAFIAKDDCDDIIAYSYVITGATSRTGSSNDASGSFNTGTSYINWTASDSWGNTVTCQTTVVINPSPSVTIPDAYALPSGVLPNTVYIGYAPASTLTLTSTVSGGTPSYGYSWSNGTLTSSTSVSPVITTTYTLTVTDANGCQGTASKLVTVIDIRGGNNMDKVIICHNNNSLIVAGNAVATHLAHGDMLGSCTPVSKPVTLNRSGITEPAAIIQPLVRVLPNPTASYFTLALDGFNPKEEVTVRVTDITGRTVEQIASQANQSLRIGASYQSGVYFAEVSQGKERLILKLVKFRD